jgi:NAD(P)-dependent dehydrogenase (short-subunit alcohol dehydrogenase family)
MVNHMSRFSGKNAIVTGATSGIGESIARHLSAEGATVAIVGRSREKGEQVVRHIQAEGGKVFYVQADVSDAKSLRRCPKPA